MNVGTDPHRPSAPALLRRLLRQLTARDRRWMTGGALLAGFSALCAIALLGVAGHFITAMALAGVGGTAINYYTPAALVRLLAILRTGGRYAERLVTHEATLRVLARLRVWLFARLVPLAPAGLGGTRSTELFSRLRSDVDALEQGYLGALVPLASALIVALVVLVVTACYLPMLALPLLLLLGVAGVLLPQQAWRRGRVPGDELVRCNEALRALAADGLLGRAELALYGAEVAHADAVEQMTDRLHRARRRLDRIAAIGGAAVALAAQCAVIAALAIGVVAVRHGQLAGPELTLLVLLALGAFEAIGPLPEAWAQLNATLASARRVFELADALPPVAESERTGTPPSGHRLIVRDLRMRYGGEGPWVLDGVDLDLAPGQRLALVGPSGAGKSSLVGALLKLYPYQGSINLGGLSLRDWHGDDVRERIAVVDQQPYLFDASLRSNLLLARPDASDAQLQQVIRQAQLEDYVAGLPKGLETWVGENGVRVSGGEARRIAIARALLADAPILLLDEPTEGLDATTAAKLYRALAVAMEGRSVLLITHRLGSLSSLVDTVVAMRDGRIVEPPALAARHGDATG